MTGTCCIDILKLTQALVAVPVIEAGMGAFTEHVMVFGFKWKVLVGLAAAAVPTPAMGFGQLPVGVI